MSQRWLEPSRRRFSELAFGTLGGWLLSKDSAAQRPNTFASPNSPGRSGSEVAQNAGQPQQERRDMPPQVPASSPVGDSQSVAQWAAASAYDIRCFPDGEKEPLAGSGIVYYRADNVDLKLDVFTPGPETVVRPTVIYIHGGGWVHLRKEERLFYFMSYLARGMNAVNVEYRLANVARAPAAVEDVRCALQWVYGHAKEYGFDVNKLIVIGESAGGHLALMAGLLNPGDGFDDAAAWSLRNTPVKAAAIINYFGPTDLVALLQEPVPPTFLIEWLGPGANRMELARQISPLTYVRKGGPPTISIQGDKDASVPHSQAVALHQALQTAGVPNELVTIPMGQHGQRNWPREQNLRAQQAIFSFLEKNGILSAAG
jgi:acetyl esterase/lipase